EGKSSYKEKKFSDEVETQSRENQQKLHILNKNTQYRSFKIDFSKHIK
ncbi:3088_t:CDS:1, partial [Dentiscutata heterogama]